MVENLHLKRLRNRVLAFLAALVLASAAFFIFQLPRLLVLNNPSSADYIAVLDGHDVNYYEGLRLLKDGMAKRMFVCLDLPDVPLRGEEIQKDLAFVRRTAGPLANAVDICKNDDEDPFTELGSVLESNSAQHVLIVTPACESRAEYIIARRVLPNFAWSVRPSTERNFNVMWWRKREWAKTYFRSVRYVVTALQLPQVAESSVERSSR